MIKPRLNRAKPYNEIRTLAGSGGFEQDGHHFTVNGEYLNSEPWAKMPTQGQPAAIAGLPEGKPEAPESVLPMDAIAELVAIARKAPAGAWIEVGVYQGGSAFHLNQAAQTLKTVNFIAFDTFEGNPYDDTGDVYGAGDFGDTSAADVINALPGARVEVGVFPDTLPEDMGEGIAFAHLDPSQKRAYRDAIEALLPRMVPGGIMVFADYGQAPGVTEVVDEVIGADRIVRTKSGRGMFVAPAA